MVIRPRPRPRLGPVVRVRSLAELPSVRLTSLPDVRQWSVELDDGTAVGRVGILTDLDTKEARYFDIRVDGRVVPAFGGRSWSILVPVGRACLDPARDSVGLPGISIERLEDIPDTPPLGVTRAAERQVLRWFGARGLRGDDAFYPNEAFGLGRLMAARRDPPATE